MKMSSPHLVPLSRQAVEIITRMSEISSKSGLIFESDFYPLKPISENTLNSAIARLGYKGLMTAHGARAILRKSNDSFGIAVINAYCCAAR